MFWLTAALRLLLRHDLRRYPAERAPSCALGVGDLRLI
jgi:hypothetical protein